MLSDYNRTEPIMNKYLVVIILWAFSWNTFAQTRNGLANEITTRLASLKQENKMLQIEFLDSIYGTPFINLISRENASRDSLRHLLVDHGFYDFNFERFNFKIKKAGALNRLTIKKKTPQLFGLLADSLYNKITYTFQKVANGINIYLILSKNDVIINPLKELRIYNCDCCENGNYQVIFKGYSTKKALLYQEDNSFNGLFENKNHQTKKIYLNDDNRFEIAVDFSQYLRKYIAIQDSTGTIFSIIKL